MKRAAAKIGLVATIAAGLVSGAQGESPLWFVFLLLIMTALFSAAWEDGRTC